MEFLLGFIGGASLVGTLVSIKVLLIQHEAKKYTPKSALEQVRQLELELYVAKGRDARGEV